MKTLRLAALAALLAILPLMAQSHAVLYNSGSSSWTDLGSLSGENGAFAYSISSAGVIVGQAGDPQAFQYSSSTMSALTGLPAYGTSGYSGAYGISPNGQYVVGFI